MPKRKPRSTDAAPAHSGGPSVRSFWSGTITFGLVSIPVDLLSAVRARQTAMKLVDKSGHALGRQYHCSKDGARLDGDDLVRGYETDGKMVEITDEDFASAAPEISSDIELRNFVPLEQIPALYFQKPYFLAPAGKSAKAYHLLAATMERTGRVGIGSFVMRGHEYLVAIVSDHGVLRADTLRYADEVRTPESIGLPKRSKGAAKQVDQFVKDIEALTRTGLDVTELEDEQAEALQRLVKQRQKEKANVIHQSGLEEAEPETAGGAQIIDLMSVLRKSLSKTAVVTNAHGSAPIDLAERRAAKKTVAPRKASSPKKKVAASRSTPRKRAKRS